MREDQVFEGDGSWSQRDYGAGIYVGECLTQGGKRDDLVRVGRAGSVHIIHAKSQADAIGQGLRQLGYYPANYKWSALRTDEYDTLGRIATRCPARGYGLLLVSWSPARLSVATWRVASYLPGNFSRTWSAFFPLPT